MVYKFLNNIPVLRIQLLFIRAKYSLSSRLFIDTDDISIGHSDMVAGKQYTVNVNFHNKINIAGIFCIKSMVKNTDYQKLASWYAALSVSCKSLIYSQYIIYN